jgi:predicted small lipoprotein YifL
MKKTILTALIITFVSALSGCGSGVPQAFIDKHNEAVALEKEAEQTADLEKSAEMDTLNKQMDSEDYAGAVKTIETALGKKKDAASKLASIDDKLAELATLSSQISNAAMKAGADKFIDISKKENAAKIKYNGLQIQMLEKTKTMVGILVKDGNGKTINAADEKTINNLIKEIDGVKSQLDAAKKEADDIQNQYKAVEKEFFNLAGLKMNE